MEPITHKSILADGSDYRISLVKLTGKQIKDVVGYLASEYSEPAFKVCAIVMEDGTEIGVEGEHDFPYLTPYRTQPQPNMDDDTIERLYKEGNPDEEDEEE